MKAHRFAILVATALASGCGGDGFGDWLSGDDEGSDPRRPPGFIGGERGPGPAGDRDVELQGSAVALDSSALGELSLEVATVGASGAPRTLPGGQGETLVGVGGMLARVVRVEVVYRDAATSHEEVVVLSEAERLLPLLSGLSRGPRFLLRVPTPGGSLSQVRLITDDVTIALRGEVLPVAVPSGEKTGLKVIPAEGESFAVTPGEETRIQIQLDPFEQLVFNLTGMRMRPVLRGIVVEPDADRDGSPDDEDCNDADPRVGPDSVEICGNSVDDDCDGLDESCPPPPELVVPPLERTKPSTIHDVSFLFEGEDAIQRDVEPGAIELRRMAVVSGRVVGLDGAPLGNVVVSAPHQPEAGHTLTRDDGRYDIAVNGTGGPVTLRFERAGLLSAERSPHVGWLEQLRIDDVALHVPATLTARIELSGSFPLSQVASGGESTDGDGARSATVFFPPEVRGEALLEDGRLVALDRVAVRISERSVGDHGREARAGSAPPNAGYLVDLDVGIDEADDLGADAVLLDREAALYVDGFIGLPVGTPLWVASYSFASHDFLPRKNAIVLRIVDVVDGKARLAVSAAGGIASVADLAALGMSDDELHFLASYRPSGSVLWRAPLTRFSSLTLSLPLAAAADAIAPPPLPPSSDATCDDPLDVSCGDDGFVIHRRVALSGTPFALHYSSGRVLGRAAAFATEIPVFPSNATAASLASLLSTDVTLHVAGQSIVVPVEPSSASGVVAEWDGTDGSGRLVNGEQTYKAVVKYTYPGQYRLPLEGQSFGTVGAGDAIAGVVAREPAVVEQVHLPAGRLGVWDVDGAYALGGLSLDVEAAYDAVAKVGYLGTGARFAPRVRVSGIVAGNGTTEPKTDGPAHLVALDHPRAVVAAPDGSVYVSEQDGRILHVTMDGEPFITHVAGSGVRGFNGDGPALSTQLRTPYGLAVEPDGNIIIADADNNRIRRFRVKEDVIETIAGTGQLGYSGDRGPAIDAKLDTPIGVAVAPDGTIYVADAHNAVVRAITGGIISTVAGVPEVEGFGADDVQATESELSRVFDVEVDPLGRLYITDLDNHRVRRIRPDGTITTVAGRTDPSGSFVAIDVRSPTSVLPLADGSFYLLSSTLNAKLYFVDATDGSEIVWQGASSDDPVTPRAVGATLSPDGSLYVVDFGGHVMHQVRLPLPGPSADGTALPLPTGETFHFDVDGRQVSTTDAFGETVLTFQRDDGILKGLLDRAGDVVFSREPQPGGGVRMNSPFFGDLDPFDLFVGPHVARVLRGDCPRSVLFFQEGRLLVGLEDVRGELADVGYNGMGQPLPTEIELAAAYPASITLGEAAVLAWGAANTTDCMLTDSGGAVLAREAINYAVVSPTESTTYSLTCNGVGGPKTELIAVGVMPRQRRRIPVTRGPSSW